MKQLSIFKQLIQSYKKFILIGFLFFIFLVIMLFPYEDVIQKLVFKLTQSPNNSITFRYESSSIGFLPPRIVFKDVQLQTNQIPQPIKSDRLIIKPAYLTLLALNPGVNIHFIKDTSSMKILMKKFKRKKRDFIHVRVQSKKLQLNHLHFLSGFFSGAKGVLEFFFDVKIDTSYATPPNATLQVKGKDISVHPFSFSKKYIGTINLPHLKWNTLSAKAKIEKQQIKLQDLTIGKNTDPFYLSSSGDIGIHFGKFRKYIKDYDIKLNLILDKKIKNLFFFIDLFLSSQETKLSDNRFQYKAQIQGKPPYPPKIKKLTEPSK